MEEQEYLQLKKKVSQELNLPAVCTRFLTGGNEAEMVENGKALLVDYEAKKAKAAKKTGLFNSRSRLPWDESYLPDDIPDDYLFTRADVARMSLREYKKHQVRILQQRQEGLI